MKRYRLKSGRTHRLGALKELERSVNNGEVHLTVEDRLVLQIAGCAIVKEWEAQWRELKAEVATIPETEIGREMQHSIKRAIAAKRTEHNENSRLRLREAE